MYYVYEISNIWSTCTATVLHSVSAVPGSPPEELVELVQMESWHITKLPFKGLVHHLVLCHQDLIVITECIHILLGLHQRVCCQLLETTPHMGWVRLTVFKIMIQPP